MTNDKFREMCDKVLIPRIGDLLHRHLIEITEAMDIYSNELIRIGARLDRIIAVLDRSNDPDIS